MKSEPFTDSLLFIYFLPVSISCSGNAYQWSLIIHLGLEDAAKGLKFEVGK